jgi:hypothetical protein
MQIMTSLVFSDLFLVQFPSQRSQDLAQRLIRKILSDRILLLDGAGWCGTKGLLPSMDRTISHDSLNDYRDCGLPLSRGWVGKSGVVAKCKNHEDLWIGPGSIEAFTSRQHQTCRATVFVSRCNNDLQTTNLKVVPSIGIRPGQP